MALKRTWKYYLAALWLTGFLLGCNTKKNTPSSRAYHNLTSRYNIYFNAKESLKSGVERIDKSVTDDYTHILPVYKYGDADAATVAVAEMELAIQKASKLIALHSVTRNPKRKSNKSERYMKFASKGEYNNWVDDSYLLMGQASYYIHDFHRAEENYQYVLRKFTNSPVRYEAYLGLAQTYIESGELEKVPDILKRLERDGGIPKSLRADINLTYAYFSIKSENHTEAIPYLKTALEYPMPHKLKIRTRYILAQLLAEQNMNVEAATLFKKVVKMKPEVDMAFNARISVLELSEGDSISANKLLNKLLKDPNNNKFRDRIYFAKGQLALKANEREKAISNFQQSVAYSTENAKQRAMSSITVGKLFYQDENYAMASAYYDSATAIIEPGYPNYSSVITRAASLKRLTDNLNTINREDSLQRIAALPSAERDALISRIISDIQRKEQEAQAAERDEMNDQNYFRAQQYRQQIRTTDNSNLWYFYNPSTAGIGKTEFQRIWGKRKLEDNWRRKNKLSSTPDDTQQLALQGDNNVDVEEVQKVSDPKTKEYYLQNVPMTDSLMQKSHERIKNSLFDAGRLFRVPFGNFPRSTAMFEELIRRYPASIYELPAYIELHQLAEQNNEPTSMAAFRAKIINSYPDSRYAKFLQNPNYFKELEEANAKMDQKYAEAVEAYRKGMFPQASRLVSEVIAMKPDSSLMARAKFIQLTSTGKSMGNESFMQSLEQYISQYPESPTIGLAVKIKDLLEANSLADYQQLLASGYINADIVNEELRNDNKINDEFGGKFSYDDDMFHYYVVAFPKQAGVKVNRLMFDIANYNIDYYTSTDFDVESVSLNPKTQMVVIRSMPNKDEGLIYFRSIIRKRPVFKTLEGVDYNNFSASSSNYRTIIADKDYTDYLKFFAKNYSPYIGSDYPKDVIEAPSELLAKVREREQPEEKGKFVVVPQGPAVQNQYLMNEGEAHKFIIVLEDSTASLAPVVAQFINFNSTVHQAEKLVTNSAQIGGKPALIVEGLKNSTQAITYFREVINNRDLYTEIENLSYSNFLITESNQLVLKNKNDLKGYVAFFRDNYLKTKQEQRPTTNAGLFADYVGPYKARLSNENMFVLVYPTGNVKSEQLVDKFNRFNSLNFGSPNILVKTEQLDEFRSVLIVTGLGEHAAAMAYYRKVNSDQSLFADLKGVNYRFFTISAENFTIFGEDKNLQLYMDYFNRVKW